LHFQWGKDYNFFGERIQWAKAHFFVGNEFGRILRHSAWRGRTERRMAVDLDQIRAIAERVAASEGLSLVDVELKGGRANPLLRIYIDKPQGVSHADCQLVSEQMSAILDVEDPFPGSYVLEVSSPGLDRKLVKPSDFVHFVGRRARLVLRQAVDEQRIIEGRLAGFEAGRVRMELGGGGVAEFELGNIAKARLVIEL
jgi:ribosome maturation factor RimP